MTNYRVPYTFEGNCLVYNSHGVSNGHYKYSFHIIIDKLVHHGVSAKELALYGEVPEARSFYRLVLDKLPTETRDLGFLDSAVYSSFQNFRLPWCQKRGSGRPKVLDPITQYVPHYEYDPNDPPELNDGRKRLALLQASLLGSSSGCQYLPSFINKDTINNKIKYNRQIKSLGAKEELTEAQYNTMVAAFNKTLYSLQYDLGEVNGMSIALHRKRSGKCPIHNRDHEGVGAYLVCDCHGNFWFNCHRCDNGIKQRGISIGHISETLEDYHVDDEMNELEDNDGIEHIAGFNAGDYGIINPPDTTTNINTNTMNILELMTQEPSIIIGPTQQEDVSVNTDTKMHTDNTKDNSHDLYYSSGIIGISTTLIHPTPNKRSLSITEYLTNILEPQQEQYVLIKTLYTIYVKWCNECGLLLEHTTQISFTKYIAKLYPTIRKKILGKMETVLPGYCLREIRNISSLVAESLDKKLTVSAERVMAQPIMLQNIKLDTKQPITTSPLILNVITDPIKIFITNTLTEFKTGYVIVKRLYTDLCNHFVKNNIHCPYTSQRGFTMDLTNKYGYDVYTKYYAGKKQAVIKGYIHKDDLQRENLKKAVKSNMHRSNYRKILKDAILVDDPRVRPILDMVNQGQGITHDQFVLMIRAACGLEKTTRIVEYIRQNSDVLKKILFVTNRISLADKHQEDLNGLGFIMYYDERQGKYIRDERSICQIDSLYKLLAEEPFDLVVFDEFTSTMSHLVSFVRNQRACNNIVEELIKTCKRVIIADALLDERYIDYVRMLRKEDIVTYQYTHRPHTDKTYSMIENKLELVRLICNDVRKGKKVVVPTNVEWLGSSLADMIRAELPNIRIGLYTAKTRKKNYIKYS